MYTKRDESSLNLKSCPFKKFKYHKTCVKTCDFLFPICVHTNENIMQKTCHNNHGIHNLLIKKQ